MTLAFREAGSPEAPVALMLHGYPNSSYLFRNVMPAAAEAGWRAVAPDMRGFGDTPPAGRREWDVGGARRGTRRVRRRRAARAARAGGPRLGRADRVAVGGREPGIGQGAGADGHRLLPRRQVARAGAGDADAGRTRRTVRVDDARRLRRRDESGRAARDRRGGRGVLEGVRHGGPAAGASHALSLRGLREARGT